MLRQLLALILFLTPTTASRFRKRDDSVSDAHARQARSPFQEPFFPRVGDYRRCIPGKSNCGTDNFQCQDTIGNGTYQCAPVDVAGSACLAPPLLANCDASGYDKNVPPAMALYGGQTIVKIDMYLRNMFQYQDSGLYNLDLFMNIVWKDPRLAHNVQPILLYHTREKLESIWRPDLFFSTAAQTYRQDMPAPSVSLRIYQDGWVEWSERIQVVTPCRYDACELTIETYDHIRNLLDVFWRGNSFYPAIGVDRSLAEKVPTVRTTYCPQDYYDGIYACLIATFKFLRERKPPRPSYVIHTMTNTTPQTTAQPHTNQTNNAQTSGQAETKQTIGQPQISQQQATDQAQTTGQLQSIQQPQANQASQPQTNQAQNNQAQISDQPQTSNQVQTNSQPQISDQPQTTGQPLLSQPQIDTSPQTGSQPQISDQPQTTGQPLVSQPLVSQAQIDTLSQTSGSQTPQPEGQGSQALPS